MKRIDRSAVHAPRLIRRIREPPLGADEQRIPGARQQEIDVQVRRRRRRADIQPAPFRLPLARNARRPVREVARNPVLRAQLRDVVLEYPVFQIEMRVRIVEAVEVIGERQRDGAVVVVGAPGDDRHVAVTAPEVLEIPHARGLPVAHEAREHDRLARQRVLFDERFVRQRVAPVDRQKIGLRGVVHVTRCSRRSTKRRARAPHSRERRRRMRAAV